MQDSLSITIEQKVQFQGGICPKKFQLNKIKNGRLEVIFYFNMRDIWETVQDSSPITVEQNVLFQGEIYALENFNSTKFKMANFRSFLHYYMHNIWKTVRES